MNSLTWISVFKLEGILSRPRFAQRTWIIECILLYRQVLKGMSWSMTNGAPEYPSTVASSRIVATMARANIRNPFVRCAFMPATEWQEFLLHIFTFTISPSSCLETLARHVRENILDNPPLPSRYRGITSRRIFHQWEAGFSPHFSKCDHNRRHNRRIRR